MALTQKQTEQIKDELITCKRPLFFFHDDPDGVSCFLLFYKIVGDGKGVIIKTTPRIDERFIHKVEEYQPDKIFILDIAMVEQEFLDAVKVPVIWIDHHAPQKRQKVKYFNPRVANIEDNLPASHVCWQAVKDDIPEDLWIAAIGSIGDWFMPDFAPEFFEKYPDLLSSEIKNPDEALFNTKLGVLTKVFSFVLNGKATDAMKCVKVLTRIKSPYEILNEETSAGKFIFHKYESMNEIYQKLLKKALAKKVPDDIFYFIYSGATSFTKDLANEVLYRYPERIIVIGRKKGDEIKMSIRSGLGPIPPVLEKSLVGLEGYGGGHEYACGAVVKEKDFKKFRSNLKKEFFGEKK